VRTTACFNGAASRRRRRHRDLFVPHQDPNASMGPPPEGGGDVSCSRAPCPASPRFNEAASRRRRRPAVAGATFVRRFERQRDPLPQEAETQARMGLELGSARLQWGRLPKEAETTFRSRSRTAAQALQWGRLPKEAETTSLIAGATTPRRCFNG